jgi:hypothetical protein
MKNIKERTTKILKYPGSSNLTIYSTTWIMKKKDECRIKAAETKCP